MQAKNLESETRNKIETTVKNIKNDKNVTFSREEENISGGWLENSRIERNATKPPTIKH